MTIDPYAGTYGDIDDVLAELKAARRRWRDANWRNAEHGSAGFPSRKVLERTMDALCGALFPLRLGPHFVRLDNEDAFVEETLRTALSRIYGQVRMELFYALGNDAQVEVDRQAARIINSFAHALPEVRALLDSDVEAAFDGDPAARSVDEVLICYPSVVAIIHYRLAHRLHRLGAPLVARIITEIAHTKTGIDIHPGAKIGARFFIDHGTGVVVGETAAIGNRVRLYQAVTLGARSFPTDEAGVAVRGLARHPVVGDDVVIYAGATLLGRISIGRGSIIGGNVWLTESVPPDSYVDQARVRQNSVAQAAPSVAE